MQKAQAAVVQPGAMPRVMPLAELEKQAILTTIRQLKGDKLMAARLLGIGKTTLYRKLKEYGLSENVWLDTLEPMNGTHGYRNGL